MSHAEKVFGTEMEAKATEVNVLIVDDSEANLCALEAVLSGHSYQVYKAASGEEALKLTLRHDFACIVLDVRMPGIDGIEVSKILRQSLRTKEVPIIFASAERTNAADIFAGYTTGAVDYIVKPIDPLVIKSKVDIFVSLKRKTMLLQEKNRTLGDLVKKNHELDELSHILSHEMKEPLRHVLTYSNLIVDEYAAVIPDEVRRFIEVIARAGTRMTNLVNAVGLLYQTARVEVTIKAVDASQVCKGVIKSLASLIEEYGCVINLEELPVLRTNEGLLEVVFRTLLQNALQFHGKKPPVVTVGAVRGEDEWVFSIKDSGIGIDPRFHKKIFDMFQRLTSERDSSSTGIGLTLCRKAVQRLDGEVWVDSAVGVGATFYFSLPDA